MDVTYTTRCDICGKEENQTYVRVSAAALPPPIRAIQFVGLTGVVDMCYGCSTPVWKCIKILKAKYDAIREYTNVTNT